MALSRSDIAVAAQHLVLAELGTLAGNTSKLREALKGYHGTFEARDVQLLQQRIRDGRAMLAWMWGQSA